MDLPNVLIVGDSVSIGYTPLVAKAMEKIALVQHSPFDERDGGAEETAYVGAPRTALHRVCPTRGAPRWGVADLFKI